jgi:hypothetical protein
MINIIIDRFENDKAVLKTEDGNTIIWPKDKLPNNTKEGSVLVFDILKDEEAQISKKKLAKNILNEILDTDEG